MRIDASPAEIRISHGLQWLTVSADGIRGRRGLFLRRESVDQLFVSGPDRKGWSLMALDRKQQVTILLTGIGSQVEAETARRSAEEQLGPLPKVYLPDLADLPVAPKRSVKALAFRIVFTILGLVLIVPAFLAASYFHRHTSTFAVAKGTVVRINSSRLAHTSRVPYTNYSLNVRYTTPEGTYTDSMRTSSLFDYSVGSSVRVLYDPKGAERPEIDNYWQVYGVLLLIVAGGVGLIYLGWVIVPRYLPK